MRFIPNSTIKNTMLKDMEINDIQELFTDIPQEISVNKLNLPAGISQQKTEEILRKISQKNKSVYEIPSFLGGGIKPHYIPSVVKSIISRGEFYSAYTPYQSEASQGFLQAMFEYQSMIAEITGMDIANCSLYDGSTALGEAVLMCTRIKKKKNFVIPKNISWEKKSILKNYTLGPKINIKEIPYDNETGKIDIDELKKQTNNDISGIYIENPNFFGIFEDDIDEIKKITEDTDSLFVVGIDPISLGIIKNPGTYGADIVIGEGRAFGNPIDFGGSSLGIFACKKEYLRQMPGRIIGLTKDKNNKRAFCMALQTREQHIRRGKATSNICTNEGLNALAAAIYLAYQGSNGLENVSIRNFEKGQKLAESITNIDGFEKRFKSKHFNEFVIKSSKNAEIINKELLKKTIQGGLIIDRWFPELKNCILFGITEIHNEQEVNRLISTLKEVSNV